MNILIQVTLIDLSYHKFICWISYFVIVKGHDVYNMSLATYLFRFLLLYYIFCISYILLFKINQIGLVWGIGQMYFPIGAFHDISPSSSLFISQ